VYVLSLFFGSDRVRQTSFLHHWSPQPSFGLVATLNLTSRPSERNITSNRDVEYFSKSFNPFQSYYASEFLRMTFIWPWPSYPVACSNLIVILQAVQKIWGHEVFHIWPCSDSRLQPVWITRCTLTLDIQNRLGISLPPYCTYVQSFNFWYVVLSKILLDKTCYPPSLLAHFDVTKPQLCWGK